MEVLDPITYLGLLHLLREEHAHLAPKISLVTLLIIKAHWGYSYYLAHCGTFVPLFRAKSGAGRM